MAARLVMDRAVLELPATQVKRTRALFSKAHCDELASAVGLTSMEFQTLRYIFSDRPYADELRAALLNVCVQGAKGYVSRWLKGSWSRRSAEDRRNTTASQGHTIRPGRSKRLSSA